MKNVLFILSVSVFMNFANADEGRTLWEFLINSDDSETVESLEQTVIGNYERVIEEVENVQEVIGRNISAEDQEYLDRVIEWLESSVVHVSRDKDIAQENLDDFYTGNFHNFKEKYEIQDEEVAVSREQASKVEGEGSGLLKHLFNTWKDDGVDAVGPEFSRRALGSIDAAVRKGRNS